MIAPSMFGALSRARASRCERSPTPPEAITRDEVAAAISFSWSTAGPSIVPSTSIAVQRKRSTPRSVRSATAPGASTSLVSVQPERETLPPRVSTETTTAAPWLATAASRNSGSRRAAVPITTRAAPAAMTAATESRSRSPPPTWIGHRPRRRSGGSRRGCAARPPWRHRDRRRGGTPPLRRPSASRRRPGRRRRPSPARSRPAAGEPPGRRGCRSPDRESRRGGRFGADAGEVGEQPQARGARLLRVELDAVDVLALGGTSEAGTVLGGAEQILGAGPGREGVDEVERRPRRQPLREARLALPAHRRPADVRDLEAIRLELDHRPLQQAEPAGAAELGGRIEEQLQAEADPEDRDARLAPLGDQLLQAELTDPLHRPRHRADAGQDHPVGGLHLDRVAGDRRGDADVLERLLGRAQVAHPVIEDRDPGAHSLRVPLVEGTPLSSGSIETATRRARAKALNAASIMWWALDPERTQMCRVSFELLATARKNSSASSLSKPAIETTGSSAAKSQ